MLCTLPLHDAWQVLSNPDLRARYDRDGSAGLDSVNIMDAGEFFNMLFGSDLFEHLVGELTIAAAARYDHRCVASRALSSLIWLLWHLTEVT